MKCDHRTPKAMWIIWYFVTFEHHVDFVSFLLKYYLNIVRKWQVFPPDLWRYEVLLCSWLFFFFSFSTVKLFCQSYKYLLLNLYWSEEKNIRRWKFTYQTMSSEKKKDFTTWIQFVSFNTGNWISFRQASENIVSNSDLSIFLSILREYHIICLIEEINWGSGQMM